MKTRSIAHSGRLRHRALRGQPQFGGLVANSQEASILAGAPAELRLRARPVADWLRSGRELLGSCSMLMANGQPLAQLAPLFRPKAVSGVPTRRLAASGQQPVAY